MKREEELKQKIDTLLATFIQTPADIDRCSLIGKVSRLCGEYEAELITAMLTERRAKLKELRDE